MSWTSFSRDDLSKLNRAEKIALATRLSQRAEAQAKSDFSRYRNDPIGFVRNVLGEDPWDKQRQILESLAREPQVTVRSCHGAGKCLGRGTPVRLFDGTVKPVEEIVVGDLLMGPDSTPRRVLSLARGRDPLYRIIPTKGDPFVCNGAHLLTLKKSGGPAFHRGPVPNGTVLDISVEDYLQSRQEFKDRWRLFRVGVDYAGQSVPIDPYILGLWLGDGTATACELTTADPELAEAWAVYGRRFGISCRNKADKTRCPTYLLSNGRHEPNPVWAAFKSLDLRSNKHLPLIYRVNSRAVRLELLAGLTDSDGHLDGHGCLSLTFKSRLLAEQTAELARSLGLAAYIATKEARIKARGYVCTVYRVNVSGDLTVIPARLSRKQAGERRQEKDVRNVGFQVEALGEGDYYGFTLDGDGRFLLGDFTVTHNTLAASWAVLWFTQTRPGSVAVTTAPTARQVRDLLWRRINGGFSRAKVPLIGRCLTTKWESIEDIEWYATGFATDDPVGFQGPHSAAGVLFVGDEASGLKEWLFESVKGWMTQDDAKMLLIGNPNQASGYFYESHRRWPASQRFHISAHDVPPHILRPEWIESMRQDYGEHSPVFHVRVLGEFPPQGENTIISLAWAEAAQNRERQPGSPCELGVDVARYGTDASVVYVRQGDRVVDAHYWRGLSTAEVAGRVAAVARQWQPEAIKVDEIGIGAGVVDSLEADGWPVIGVNVGQSAVIKPDEYENLRTEIFMDLAERFRDGSIDIPLEDQMLVDQLTSLTYSYTPKGKRKLVSKEDMRKARQGASLWSSPDRADALALCFASNLGGWAPVVFSGPPREDGGWRPDQSPQGTPLPW